MRAPPNEGKKDLGFGCGEGCGPPKKRAAEKVSETARELFNRRGIRAVGVDEIVTQAGVTKPSLYRSYPSKDDLIACCLREHAEEGRERFERAVASAPGNPRQQLSNAIKAFAELALDKEFRGCPISNAAVEFPDPCHPVHTLARQMKQDNRERWLALIQQLGVKDPEGLTDGLILLGEGASSAFQSYGCSGPVTCFVQSAEALIDSHLDKR
jgi:AcrR family transcriptional regulator